MIVDFTAIIAEYDQLYERISAGVPVTGEDADHVIDAANILFDAGYQPSYHNPLLLRDLTPEVAKQVS
ncbi:MAG: hypothetical protein J2P37_00145 [Ktedonobacteraceae bacterium]|nr:hypothetical protein [Ktedonobacteraceae bacterium]